MTFFAQQSVQKKRSGFLLRPTAFLMIVMVMLVFSAPQARADAWGSNYYAAYMKQMMEKIQYSIYGVLIGSLKMTAVQMLNSQVNQLIGGGSAGQALFITDYNQFLYQTPQQNTDLYMNDFFTMTTRGKGSSANYIGMGGAGGVGGNYSNYLIAQAQQATVNGSPYAVGNLDEYTAGPDTMFREGDWRAFNAFFSNPANNPYGYTIMAEQAYQGELARQQEIARVKAQSSGGFLPKEQNGKVLAPAGSIEAVTTQIQTMPNRIIENATNPMELLSGVVGAMANRLINNMVQQGIGEVQANIQREMGSVNFQTGNILNQATQSLGPAARFAPAVVQKINTSANSGTPPIPDNGAGGP